MVAGKAVQLIIDELIDLQALARQTLTIACRILTGNADFRDTGRTRHRLDAGNQSADFTFALIERD
jgi:hypothetical protein